jgi:hypothetical protein
MTMCHTRADSVHHALKTGSPGLGLMAVVLIMSCCIWTSCRKEVVWRVDGRELTPDRLVKDQVHGLLPSLACQDAGHLCKNLGDPIEFSCEHCHQPAWVITAPTGAVFKETRLKKDTFMPDRSGTWMVQGRDGAEEVAFYVVVRANEGEEPSSSLETAGADPSVDDAPSKGNPTGIEGESPQVDNGATGSAEAGKKGKDQPPAQGATTPSPDPAEPPPPPVSVAKVSKHGFKAPIDVAQCISHWVDKASIIIRADRGCELMQCMLWTDRAGTLTITLARSGGRKTSMRTQPKGGSFQVLLKDLLPDLDANEEVSLTIEASGCRIADLGPCSPEKHSPSFLKLVYQQDVVSLVDLMAK